MAFLGGFFNQFLQQIGQGDDLRDYQHASRTFVDSLYRLSPKMGTLFHVFVDLNQQVASTDQNSQIEIGLMAKRVNLPRYSVQTKTLNSYNRKTINQERIKYDPVNMVFHDDSADVVRKFWYDYYRYYYRDSDYEQNTFDAPHKYNLRQQQEWGFSPRLASAQNFISSIRIYSLHQKRFSSYALIRPTITSFQHGEHVSGAYEPLEHQMSLEFEAVLYEEGAVSNGSVQGFNVIHYDNTPSPLTSLGGGTTSILGPGGLVDGIGDTVTNLANGNFLGAGLGAFRTFNNFKNADLKTIASAEVRQTAINVVRGQPTNTSVYLPTASSVKNGIAKAITPKDVTDL